jgi:predicted permease
MGFIKLAILLPIALGYVLRQLQIFKEAEVAGLRKFVMKIGIPFLVFNNLLRADVKSLTQAAPIIFCFALITVLYTAIAHFTAPLVSPDPRQRAAYSYAVFAGNYAFLGWGVIASFFGEQALTRAVFFSMFFWPVFLLTGFWLDQHSGGIRESGSRRSFLPILIRNAGVPISSVVAGLLLNLLGWRLPGVLDDFVTRFAAIGIPLILFTIGLSLRLMLPRAKMRIVIFSSAVRLVFGFIPGLAVVVVMRLLLPIDPLSQKVVLMQAVMPTATMSTFFLEYVKIDDELLSGAIACSTIASLFTFPLWFWVIQKLF